MFLNHHDYQQAYRNARIIKHFNEKAGNPHAWTEAMGENPVMTMLSIFPHLTGEEIRKLFAAADSGARHTFAGHTQFVHEQSIEIFKKYRVFNSKEKAITFARSWAATAYGVRGTIPGGSNAVR
jgi:hypothetical protein